MMYNYPLFNFPFYRGFPGFNYYPTKFFNNRASINSNSKKNYSNFNSFNNTPNNGNVYNKNYYNPNISNNNSNNNNNNSNNNIKSVSKNTLNNFNSSNNKTETETNSIHTEELQYFEIMGIKLYFDDILIICLIFFLYSEGVTDQWLFISLVLLLIS